MSKKFETNSSYWEAYLLKVKEEIRRVKGEGIFRLTREYVAAVAKYIHNQEYPAFVDADYSFLALYLEETCPSLYNDKKEE